MKHIKRTLIILTLFSALSIQAKQMGQKKVSQGYGQQQQIPTGPVQEPIIPNIPNQPFTSGPTYTDILALFRDKNPDSSDFSTLKNIKNEAETQINLGMA
jgi:hypothetical protein